MRRLTNPLSASTSPAIPVAIPEPPTPFDPYLPKIRRRNRAKINPEILGKARSAMIGPAARPLPLRPFEGAKNHAEQLALCKSGGRGNAAQKLWQHAVPDRSQPGAGRRVVEHSDPARCLSRLVAV